MTNRKCSASFLSKYIHQLETNLQNFTVPSLIDIEPPKHEEQENPEQIAEEDEEESPAKQPICPDFAPYQPTRPIYEPSVCMFYFMEKDELEDYLALSSKRKMKEVLGW